MVWGQVHIFLHRTLQMKITPVARHGLKLTRLGLVNCYLVREDDGYTLVDANLRGSEGDILEAAGKTPIEPLPLRVRVAQRLSCAMKPEDGRVD